MPLIQSLSFNQWISHAFDHPDDATDWHDHIDSDYWSADETLKAEHIAETFENADKHLARFSDRQLETGLWFIVGPGYTADALENTVPTDLRLRLIRSTYDLYRKLFAVRCGTLDFGGTMPLYSICYMFWEKFPLSSKPKTVEDVPLCEEMLKALEKILKIENLMCQYSALHGLGHAHLHQAKQTTEAVDRYLARHTETDFKLRDYALAARKGCVQ